MAQKKLEFVSVTVGSVTVPCKAVNIALPKDGPSVDLIKSTAAEMFVEIEAALTKDLCDALCLPSAFVSPITGERVRRFMLPPSIH